MQILYGWKFLIFGQPESKADKQKSPFQADVWTPENVQEILWPARAQEEPGEKEHLPKYCSSAAHCWRTMSGWGLQWDCVFRFISCTSGWDLKPASGLSSSWFALPSAVMKSNYPLCKMHLGNQIFCQEILLTGFLLGNSLFVCLSAISVWKECFVKRKQGHPREGRKWDAVIPLRGRAAWCRDTKKLHIPPARWSQTSCLISELQTTPISTTYPLPLTRVRC